MARFRPADFPPYHLLDGDYTAAEREAKRKLERLYHHTRDKAWDGREVLGEALERHGGIQLPDHKREAIARIFSIILWGELAAWHIGAELAHMLDDPEAKMAATGQAFDEARHFATMRDYLLALGLPNLPPLEPFTREILRDVLEAESVAVKVVGMHLLVENVALTLFQLVAEGETEPVLSEILPFFERDEARHVGLGVMHLPEILKKISWLDALRLQAFQVKVTTFITWGTLNLRKDFHRIGVDPHEGMTRGLRYQQDVYGRVDPEHKSRGLYRPSSFLADLQSKTVGVLFPPKGEEISKWHSGLISVMGGMAKATAFAVNRVSSDGPGLSEPVLEEAAA